MTLYNQNYLNTVDGELAMRAKRKRRRLLFAPMPFEPRSKNSISDDEALAFQKAVLETLNTFGKRFFRSDVAIEFDFFPAASCPPAIHSLPKNYLDLLERPLPSLETGRKRLVFDDDRQVRYLAVKYHIQGRSLDEEGDDSNAVDIENRSLSAGIWLKAAPFANLVEDIGLLKRLERGDVQRDGLRYGVDPQEAWQEICQDEEQERWMQDNPVHELHDFEREKQSWINRFGEDVYEAWRQMALIDVQKHLLSSHAVTPRKLIELFSPYCSDVSGPLANLHAMSREMMISPPMALDLHHSDLAKGESKIFKQLVRDAIEDFKKRFSHLFPMATQAGLTILYQPPENGMGIDLDNLARRIVPYFNEIVRPISNPLFTVDIDSISDTKIAASLRQSQASLKGMPKHSITHYQVIQLPRLDGDSEHGFVRLALEPGDCHYTLWQRIERYVDIWEEKMRW